MSTHHTKSDALTCYTGRLKIEKRIIQVLPGVFAVIIPDRYDRAMVFSRAQEYYESASTRFRGKDFSYWEYMKWYATKYGRGFSYTKDWSGFNIPLETIKKCYQYPAQTLQETPYDAEMNDIILEIDTMLGCTNPTNKKGYVIGCQNTRGYVFKHELCHGKYHTNSEYRELMQRLIASEISPYHYKLMRKNIMGMGYAAQVVDDEIQAYLQYGYEHMRFRYGMRIPEVQKYHKIFIAANKLLCRPVIVSGPTSRRQTRQATQPKVKQLGEAP